MSDHWDLDRVNAAPWPYEPPTDRMHAVPTNWTPNTGHPVYGPHPNDHVRRIVTKDRRETRHGLHLILTICTFGLWALTGWPIAWLWNRFGPRRKTTTNYR